MPYKLKSDKLLANERYQEQNKEKIRSKKQEYYKKNREKIIKRSKKHYEENKEEISIRNKLYREENKELIKNSKEKYYEKNKVEILAKQAKIWKTPEKQEKVKKYKISHAKEIRDYNRKYSSTRREEDLNFRILGNLRNRLRLAVQNNQKEGTTLELIDCDIDFLKKHLESQFQEGMTWENYGSYWSIEHKKACCLFDLTDPIQQKECFHWSNLSVLTLSDNSKKGQEDKKLALKTRIETVY